MSKILVQAKKEWIEFNRDRLSLALAFILPVFSLLLFGYGIRLESKNIAVAVKDFDRSQLSREYIERLWATNIFAPARLEQRKEQQPRSESASKAVDRGRAKVAITIPAGFSKSVFRKERSPLEVQIDGTDLNNTQIVYNTLKIANARFIQRLLSPYQPILKGQEPVRARLRIWSNPGLSEELFIVPGVFGVILWMYPALLAAVAASREKEQGTIIKVYSSPLSGAELLAGKALVYCAVGLLIAIITLGLGAIMFGVIPKADPTPLLVGTPIYVATAVLFGLLLGTFSSSQTTAVQATSSAGFFPCLLLSGFVYPISNIPFPLSLFSIIVPGRYFIDLDRQTLVRGVGWQAVWQDPLIMAGFLCAFSLVAWLGVRQMQLKS